MAKNIAVFGIYPNYAALEQGIDALRLADFRATDISVLYPENVGTKDIGHEKASKAPEGASTGASTGMLAGGALGWLLSRLEVPESTCLIVHSEGEERQDFAPVAVGG